MCQYIDTYELNYEHMLGLVTRISHFVMFGTSRNKTWSYYLHVNSEL